MTAKKEVPKKEEKELRTWLEEEWFDKIDKIKERIGVRNTTELMRILINEKYYELFEKSPLDHLIEDVIKSLKNK